MDFLPPKINEYVERYTRGEGEVLKSLDRETHVKVLMPQMLSGHLQGQVLRMFSCMVRPKNILEIGTYTGYSAICMAEGMQADGMLYTIDINEELEEMVRQYIARAGMEDQIDFRVGDAMDIIPQLDITLDMVYIDADKVNYSNYYDLVWDKVRPGGFIIADNVLWSGKVLDTNVDEDTQALKDFTQKVHTDPRAENVLFPIRDGLMVIRKKQE